MGDTVYILTNEAMPGLVKIGRTSKPIEERLKELGSKTGVPLPFSCYYAAEVDDAAKLEDVFHKAYADNRVNPNREFFSISPEAARTILKEFEISDRTVSEQFEDDAEKAAFEKISKVRSFFDFNEIGINPGEEVEFVRDSTIKATVYDDSTINFNGKITSLSAAAGEILNKDKDVKSRYNGVLYWSYKGQTLYELRKNKRRE
tara:strand:+ start:64 stop:672 length:609 start_codon:yes stop_codon:yes gene_type:complete